MLPCACAMRRIRLLLGLSLVAALVVAAPASASLDAIVADLRDDGAIEPCAHTSKELKAALDEIGPDVDQYAPELPSAIRDALAARAGGACKKDRGGGGGGAGGGGGGETSGGGGGAVAGGATGGGAPAPGGAAAPEAATPTPETPLTAAPAVVQEAVPPSAPAAIAQASDDGAPVLLLAILGGVVALGVLSFLAARWWAWEPRWLLGTRHACTEAGYRASATWAEFTDWVRLGR